MMIMGRTVMVIAMIIFMYMTMARMLPLGRAILIVALMETVNVVQPT